MMSSESACEEKQSQYAASSEAVEKCTQGLVEKFENPVRGVNASLELVNNRQALLADRLEVENGKFTQIEKDYNVSDMLQKTRHYQQKLASLQKEMVSLTEKSSSMRSRAMKLQEAKQREALKREHKRQMDMEKEELLVAKPSSTKK